jgi:hypothetical protein
MDVKVTMPTRKGISGYLSYSLMKGSATLPAVGGLFLGEEALQQLDGSEDIAITQDQRHTIRGRLRYDLNPRVWAAATFHYGSGLPVEIEEGADAEVGIPACVAPACVEVVARVVAARSGKGDTNHVATQ